VRKVLGILTAAVLALSVLGGTALAVSENSGNPYDGSDGWGLLGNGKVTLCHYTGHSHVLPNGNLEYDWLIRGSLGAAYCVDPGIDVDPGMIILVSPNALDGHQCFIDGNPNRQTCSDYLAP